MSETSDNESKFKATKRALKLIDKKIEELESLSKRPKQYLIDYFSQLEKTIENKREEDKKKLDLYYNNILKEIRIYRKDLEGKLNSSDEKFDTNVKSDVYIDYLNDWITEYNIQYKRDKNAPLEHIIFESNLFKSKLDHQIRNVKKSLFNGLNYELNEDKLTLKLKLPSIKINKIEQNDSLDLVRFNLKNFKQFQTTKRSLSKPFETSDIKWKFYVENDLEDFISCFVQINFDIVLKKSVEAEFQVDLVHPDEKRRNFSKWSRHTFKKESPSDGWNKFINMKDLVRDQYFNESDDSITFEIFIHFKNEKNKND